MIRKKGVLLHHTSYFVSHKKLFCEKPNTEGKDSILPEKMDGVVPTEVNSERKQLTFLREVRIAMARQLLILSPANSRTGRLILCLVIFVIIVAIWNLDKILENNKQNRILRYDYMFSQRKFRDIISETTDLIESGDGYAEDHYFRGLAYFMLHEEDNALKDFQIVVEHPSSHIAHVSSSLCYSCFAFLKFEKYEDALQVVEESIKINPYSSVAFKGKGEALMALERWSEALESFDQSLTLDPDNIGCLYNKAQVYRALDQNDQALEIIDTILSQDMFDVVTHKSKLQILFDSKKFDKAVQEIEIIESLFGTSSFYYYLKGDALVQLGNYSDALLNIENALFVSQGNLSNDIIERLSDLKNICQRQLQYY